MKPQTLFSSDRRYRYVLWRSPLDMLPSKKRGYLNAIGLNPSTADEVMDDRTVWKWMQFARRWGYDALAVTNVFAFRATEPEVMLREADPVGPDNDQHIVEVARRADMVLCCWGVHAKHMNRGADVARLLAATGKPLWCLGLNSGGSPVHPLYQSFDTPAIPYAPTL